MSRPRLEAVHPRDAKLGQQRPKLRAVPPLDSDEFEVFSAELLADEEFACTLEGSTVEHESLFAINEKLLALGLPVAFLAGDRLPDVEDESDPHEATVTSIRIAYLHRYLREMPTLQSKVMRLFWGIGDDGPHSQTEVAHRTGLSQASVSRALVDGMAELRRRFGVTSADLAA